MGQNYSHDNNEGNFSINNNYVFSTVCYGNIHPVLHELEIQIIQDLRKGNLNKFLGIKLEDLYYNMAHNSWEAVLEELSKIPEAICSNPLNENDQVFFCDDCKISSIHAFCKECFYNGNHDGHRIR